MISETQVSVETRDNSAFAVIIVDYENFEILKIWSVYVVCNPYNVMISIPHWRSHIC